MIREPMDPQAGAESTCRRFAMRIQRAVCVFTCVPQRSDIDNLSADVPAVWTRLRRSQTLQVHGFIARVGNTLTIGQNVTMSCCVADPCTSRQLAKALQRVPSLQRRITSVGLRIAHDFNGISRRAEVSMVCKYSIYSRCRHVANFGPTM